MERKSYFDTPVKDKMMPATMRTMRRAQSMPPHAVKSILVWNAKRVRPKVTPQVIPTAMRMASALKRAQRVPNMNP